MTDASDWIPRAGSKAALFFELAQPDEDGFTRKVSVSEFQGKYQILQFGNVGTTELVSAAIGMAPLPLGKQ